MRHLFTSLAVVLLLTGLWCGIASAEGFGSPTMDGQLDGVYGAAEASDPTGDGNGNANMDLIDLHVCNDNNFWYFYFSINANISSTNWGKYRLYIDTTNDTAGATSDHWPRNVVVNDTHKPEYGLATWVDNAPYGPEDTQFWAWDQGTEAWTQYGSLDGAALNASTVSGIEWKIARSRIGDPDTIWVEVWSTGGTDGDNAQDTSNDPAGDWDAVDWSSQADLDVSTMVVVATGGDTTPPTVESATIVESERAELLVSFSEPLDPTTAETAGNYDVTGVNVTGAALQTDSSKVLLTLDADMGLGSCIAVEATNVEDVAGNPIVENGTTNVYDFYLTELTFRAQMRLYLRNNSAAPDPDTVAIEGGVAPLTWNPLCDDLLTGPDGDSVFTGTFVFQNTCTAGVTDTTTMEYKFTHQCVNWESSSNHVYTLNGEKAQDTLNIWWNDEAPVDFTDKPIDVIFFLRPNKDMEWDRVVDSLAINGSESPLNWDTEPPTNLLLDDGALPDSLADDEVFSYRITFPTGTRKSVYFKYLWKSETDTTYNYECFNQSNRDVFLNDTLYSEANPIVLPVHVWNCCQTAVDDGAPTIPARVELRPNVPNPFNPTTEIAFSLPAATSVELAIYDVAGRMVRQLLKGEMPAGPSAVSWNGKDDSGRSVSSGVYFYRLRAAGADETRKMVLIR
ncbi:MAG: T9SS type A sorting domain-containing protein [Candidatus Eisenbacteria bacterium]|nr:T9SS type A sorting domain-containing protein [Candidatus Eisenbacteria bacterium]